MGRLFEFDKYITPDGQEHNFHNGTDRFLLSFTGQGMPPIEYITQQGPNQHGETVIDYRLQKRVIQYVIRNNGCDRQGYWEDRAQLLNMLRPNRQVVGTFAPGKLRKYMPGGYIRDINVFIEQGPEFTARNPDDWDEYGFTEVIRFIAHDPIFYNPTQVCLDWTIVAIDHLIFPFSFFGADMSFQTAMINASLSVIYTGSWFSYPTIIIHGPLDGPIITNESTGEVIRINRNIGSNEILTINLQFGNKTVSNDAGANLIGSVSDDSDLATFHIAPDPEVTGGINTITVVGGSADINNTLVQIAYNTRYIGI